MQSGVSSTGPDSNPEIQEDRGRDLYELWNASTDFLQTCINGSVTTTTAPVQGVAEDTFAIFWKIKLAGAALLVLFCFVSVICNVCVLAAARWIKKRPLTTIMKISLSLTAADSISSLLLGIGLFFNTLIVYIRDAGSIDSAVTAGAATVAVSQLTCSPIPSLPPTSPPQSATQHYGCFNLVLEAVRLGAILVTMLHLLFLAAVHYLGTVRPLCRLVHAPGTFVLMGLAILWVCPPAIMLAAFAWYPDDGFRSPTCSFNFLMRRQFHLSFSLAFFLVLVAMVVIYLHIYVVVHRTQRARQHFQRTGSAYHKQAGQYRTANGAPDRHSIRGGGLEEATYAVDTLRSSARHKRSKRAFHSTPAGGSPQRSKNRKAIITTLCILGSYLVGWMPAVVCFMLICKDCFVPYESLNPFVLFGIFWLVNFLVILKTMCNAFIYTARMKDIKDARRSMCQALHRLCCRLCCRLLFRTTTTANSAKLSLSESSHQRLSLYTRTSAPVRQGTAARLRGPVIATNAHCRTDV